MTPPTVTFPWPAREALEYEYVRLEDFRSVGYGSGTFPGFWEHLQQRGRDGWELCGFEYGLAFFKRRIRND